MSGHAVGRVQGGVPPDPGGVDRVGNEGAGVPDGWQYKCKDTRAMRPGEASWQFIESGARRSMAGAPDVQRITGRMRAITDNYSVVHRNGRLIEERLIALDTVIEARQFI